MIFSENRQPLFGIMPYPFNQSPHFGMMELGRERIQAHEAALSSYAHERLRGMNALRIIGQARGKGAISPSR
jgi:hypothetical protein